MPISHRSRRHSLLLLATACAVTGAFLLPVRAGEITLKNGTKLQGTKVSPLQTLTLGPQKGDTGPVPIYNIVMVASELQRYFVPRLRVENVNKDADLSKFETFTVPQIPKGRSKSIQAVGSYLEVTPFNEFGNRRVSLATSGGKEVVFQGITKITPQYVKIEALNYLWETAIATSSIPTKNLDEMLRKVTKANNPDHRLAIARFYLQAERYQRAEEELEAIKAQFTELSDTVAEALVSLKQLQAQQWVSELKVRQAGGQHVFVYEACRRFSTYFPADKVGAAVLRDVRDITADYEKKHKEAQEAVILMGELQAQIKDADKVAEVAPRRSEIAERLNINNFDRLDAFLKLAKDAKLPAADKLALALSGWVVGSANAVTDLDLALRLWKARFLVLDYLRTPVDGATERNSALDKLLMVEGVGPTRIAQMLPLLPPLVDTLGVKPESVLAIEVPARAGNPAVQYSVLLPLEYHPDHAYPTIIALRSQGRTAAQELDFWGGAVEGAGQSQRHGYLVITPEYAPPGQRAYDYGASAHYAVIEALHDARKRFHIDSDRVFLSGHAMGGDAALDIGFAHPDLFAGVIPLGGVIDKFSKIYADNARDLPIYMVAGEYDRDSVARNSIKLTEMMKRGYDLIYTEFIGCGQDSFYAEIHKLFDWMARQKRSRFPTQIDAVTRRACDNRFFWLEFAGLPEGMTTIDWASNQRKPVPPIKARLTPGGGAIEITSPAATNTVWLSPDLIKDLFNNRLNVRVNGKPKWNDFIKPDVGALLEDFRRRSDRQQLYWAVLSF